MNKDLINGLPADEQAVAEKLSSAAEMMKLAESFQWSLETQLMDAYQSKKVGMEQRPFMKFLTPIGWAIAAVAVVLLAGWMMRSLSPGLQPAVEPTITQEASFESDVRTGTICTGPLAIAHGFAVFLTNEDKSGFLTVDNGRSVDELRSFRWSADGEQLAVFGNTTGSGNIFVTQPSNPRIDLILSNPELGYIVDGDWSRDGKQFVLWSLQNNQKIYLLNMDGTGFLEQPIGVQILGVPQFTPDGKGIIFYGADSTSAGLFEVLLDGSPARLISSLVEDATAFGFSPDGSQLAYVESDRTIGEARLIAEGLASREKVILASWSIPEGSGSSLPNAANLSWAPDGKSIVFDLGRSPSDRFIFVTYVESRSMIRVADSAYAPAISGDGNCLAYVSNKQVFLLDLTEVSPQTVTARRLLIGDLPDGRGNADSRLDRLGWKP